MSHAIIAPSNSPDCLPPRSLLSQKNSRNNHQIFRGWMKIYLGTFCYRNILFTELDNFMVPMLKVIFAFLEPGGIGKTVGLELSGFKTLKTK